MADYITEAEGTTYMGTRLNTTAWDNASSADRVKAIKMATRAIDQLNYRGKKTDEGQVNQFPRDDDTAIPQDIKDACAEEALSLLDGRDPELEFENLDMISQTYDGVKSDYDRKTHRPENLLSGIMSLFAWRFLKPYLRDNTVVDLNRVN